jgi:hypothetical protein
MLTGLIHSKENIPRHSVFARAAVGIAICTAENLPKRIRNPAPRPLLWCGILPVRLCDDPFCRANDF